MPRTPPPPPLPPQERTVGQLVAETIRLYGRRFWTALPLGLAVAAPDQLTLGASRPASIAVLAASAPLFTLAYAAAAALTDGRRPPLRTWLVALAGGVAVFIPAALLFPWFALAAVAWLALAGLVVPVAVVERAPLGRALRRGLALGRADYLHALGSLAALTLLFFLTTRALGFVLQIQGDNTARAAIFLADLVVSPLLFLGAALLYTDQAARASVVRSPSRKRVRRRSA